MYSIRLEGDTQAMLRKIRSFSEIDKKSINAALAEGVRESTLERFKKSRDPSGKRWKTSIRAETEGGKTLIQSAQLRNSIHAKSVRALCGHRIIPIRINWRPAKRRFAGLASKSLCVRSVEPSRISTMCACSGILWPVFAPRHLVL